MEKYSKLPVAFKRKWVKALRSGKYEQGIHVLKSKKENAYCCLGVAGEVCGLENVPQHQYFTSRIKDIHKIPVELWGLKSNDIVCKLVILNDSKQWSFGRIATWIEENL